MRALRDWPQTALIAIALAAVCACGQTIPPKRTNTVRLAVPSPGGGGPVIATLQPPPTPSPTPVPEVSPLPAPAGAHLQSAAARQDGAAYTVCWQHAPSPTGCTGASDPAPPSPLVVRKGESLTLTINAAKTPDVLSLRPFQDDRTRYPEQNVTPGMQIAFTVDLNPGDWLLEACATFNGHGRPCWLFHLDVRAGS